MNAKAPRKALRATETNDPPLPGMTGRSTRRKGFHADGTVDFECAVCGGHFATLADFDAHRKGERA
jgi:hypothetical protein